jgi:hypothetical protein
VAKAPDIVSFQKLPSSTPGSMPAYPRSSKASHPMGYQVHNRMSMQARLLRCNAEAIHPTRSDCTCHFPHARIPGHSSLATQFRKRHPIGCRPPKPNIHPSFSILGDCHFGERNEGEKPDSIPATPAEQRGITGNPL